MIKIIPYFDHHHLHPSAKILRLDHLYFIQYQNHTAITTKKNGSAGVSTIQVTSLVAMMRKLARKWKATYAYATQMRAMKE